jgi:DNA-binding FadR family transcriptional regulator
MINTKTYLLSRMPGGEREIHKRTVKDQVADKLAYMIQSGLLQVNDELPSERELASTLQVSRESIRGAIAVLAAHGMIGVSQGARTRVVGTAGMTLAESVGALSALKGQPIERVTQAREVVEVQIIRMASQCISPAELERLDQLLRDQALMHNDPVAFQISDREFHGVLYAACGNQLLCNFVSDLYDYALDYRRQALRRPGAIQQSVKDHEQILRALVTKDAVRAEKAMLGHLAHIYATTVQEMSGKSGKHHD